MDDRKEVRMFIGTCDICKKENLYLGRTYFNYDIECECCSPNHFEIINHCKDCEPVEPQKTRIILKTNKLTKRDVK